MKKYLTIEERDIKRQVVLFVPVKQKDRGAMRAGKTKKDKLVTKSWANRFANQQARADKFKRGR